ncbi:hypothetical protein [Vibrio gallicus]|uniref:hypothetical protein n=1 Tax=Vibrio gallicus TaxID=190897 RepID=UPI0021C4213E|nr:hypothetical protein [Vibrio gallicus]
MPIARVTMLETALENMFDPAFGLTFSVTDIGAGKIKVIFKYREYNCSQPMILMRDEVRAFLYAEEAIRADVYNVGIQFKLHSQTSQNRVPAAELEFI